ncbi:anti-repressor SinI family protein [Halobacillus sp. H74]
MKTLPRNRKLDDEWVSLLKEAKDLGLSAEEVKNYLRNGSKNRKTV